MDPSSEQRLVLVVPELAEKVRAAHDDFAAKTGSTFRVVQGLRTYQEQDALYAQSRTAPGPDVTNARGGFSNHNFGMAVDCVPSAHTGPTYEPDWNTAHPAWHTMVDCLKAQGLFWGGDWTGTMHADVDHFQLAGAPDTPTQQDRLAFAEGGLPAVWASYGFGISLSAAADSAEPLAISDARMLLVLLDDAIQLLAAAPGDKYAVTLARLYKLHSRVQNRVERLDGTVDISASSSSTEEWRFIITQVILEDLDDEGPISQALEGWKA
jgi:hypothetical protein